FGRRAHLEPEQLTHLFLADAIATALVVRLAAAVHEHAREVVAEHDLDLQLAGDLGDEADGEVRPDRDPLGAELGLGSIPHGGGVVERVHALEPLELALTALLGHERLGVVVVTPARRLVRMCVSAHRALDATDLVAVALQDDVLGVRPALRAIGDGLAAVAGALITTEVALEDLVHPSISR